MLSEFHRFITSGQDRLIKFESTKRLARSLIIDCMPTGYPGLFLVYGLPAISSALQFNNQQVHPCNVSPCRSNEGKTTLQLVFQEVQRQITETDFTFWKQYSRT